MPNANMNYTSSPGVVPVDVQQFMFRTFLPRVTNNRVYGRDLQRRALPAHNGKRVVFNKMNPFSVDTTPLKEGVTPDGQNIITSTLTATVKPYGKYTALTDEIDWAMIDGFKREASLRLGDQANETLEAITRDALATGVNVQYVGQTSRNALTADNILTYDEIKKAVRTLAKNKAKPFADGFYHAVIGPETKFDLMSDKKWQDVTSYLDASNLEQGEIGRIYKVKFFESTDPMIFKKEAYLYANVASIAISGYDAAAKVVTVAATAVNASKDPQELEYFVRCMAGRILKIGGDTTAVVDHAKVDGANVKVYLRWISDEAYAYASGDKLEPMGAGSGDVEVHGTIIYGQDFAGDVALEGSGDNVQMIVKPLGSSGTEDPLNQRGTMGWKVKGYTATILQDSFIVRIEHCVSA